MNLVSNGTGGATNYPLVAYPGAAVDSPDFTLTASGAGMTGGADASSGGLSDTYTIDAWGNRQESGTFTFSQPFSATNQIMATGYQYDHAGNLTSDGLGNTYSYDAESKMSASNGAVYTRDPFGQRVRKDFSGAATEYYYFGGALLATMNPASAQWTDYIYAAGRLVAEVPVSPSDTPLYRIGDQLDSLAQKTDNAGNVLGTNDLSPWGEVIDSSAEDRLLFTQHERDTENDSDSTLYRQYASDQGRWLSPDPSNSSYNLYDPQSFNRYAYVGNRPNNTTDPLGLDEDCDFDCGGIGIGIGDPFGGSDRGSSPHLPGEQTNPSPADTSAADSGLPGDTVGQPGWDKWVLDEQLGLPPSLAAQLGSGGLLSVLELGADTCDFGPCIASNNAAASNSPTINASAAIAKIKLYARIGYALLQTELRMNGVCSVGAFGYGGRSFDAGPVNGFAGAIIEGDSASGVSKGALFELGGGEVAVGGVGKIVSVDRNGLGSSILAYGGVGGGVPGGHAAGGLVAFGSGSGVFGEISAGGREIGIGVYEGACKHH